MAVNKVWIDYVCEVVWNDEPNPADPKIYGWHRTGYLRDGNSKDREGSGYWMILK